MERNYHIFYMLCAACEPDYCLGAPEDFRYLNKSGCTAIDGVDDEKELATMVAAFNGLGFTDDERGGVFSVVAAVLHLGNLEFEPKGGSGHADGSQLTEGSQYSLGQAARLLEVDPALLEASLGELNYTIRGENVRVFFTPEKVTSLETCCHSLSCLPFV
jgi:myosin-5